MKVLFLSYDFGEYSIRLTGALAQDAEVLLLLPEKLAAPHLSWLNPAVRLKPFQAFRRRQPLRQLQLTYRLTQEIKAFNPDVIHFQHGHLWFNLALPFLQRYPLVLTVHDPRHHLGDHNARKTPQAIMDLGYRLADQIIVHGRQLKQVVVDQVHLPAEIVHIIPHIVLGDDTAQSQVQEEDNVLLFFGRIWEYKGLEYLIRAEPLITAQFPDIKIIIAGHGEDFERYRRMMVHPEQFLVYNEYISDEKRAELFRRASIVVLPYIDASQSGVIPVAYTFSKPVIATSVGGLAEMVAHGQTGYLVPPRDEKALAHAIVKLLQDKKLRHQMGTAGKQMVDTECSPEVVAQKTLAVYQHTLDETQWGKNKRSSYHRLIRDRIGDHI